jgi:acyl transferase domain-containing protein/NAD(P)-dependent dehydrogenase (short-subunit alcohol dehydrogenase family)/acyl carrier protein
MHPTKAKTQLLAPRWRESSIRPNTTTPPPAAPELNHVIVLCEHGDVASLEVEQAIYAAIGTTHVLRLPSSETDIERAITNDAVSILEKLQELLRLPPGVAAFVQLVIPRVDRFDQAIRPALGTILKCAQQECPEIRGQVITIDGAISPAHIAAAVRDGRENSEVFDLHYHVSDLFYRPDAWDAGTQRFELTYDHLASVAEEPACPWSDPGVYVISGGSGALGLHCAEEIARQPHSSVVLLGRSPLSNSARDRLSRLDRKRVVFHQVDVGDQSAVQREIDRVRSEIGPIRGVIHAAGVTGDGLIVNKRREDLREVFAAKIAGLVHLDCATAADDLRFFAAFSSIAAVYGGAGQSAYATANACMDHYMQARERRASLGARTGASVSIAWPLWRDGGMQLDVEKADALRKLGLIPLSVGDGIDALCRSIACCEARVVALHTQQPDGGQHDQHGEHLDHAPAFPDMSRAAHGAVDAEALVDNALARLSSIFTAALKLDPEDVDPDASLENYGADSLLVLHMTRELEKRFGSLPKTLFFEQPTLRALSRYLAQTFPDKCGGEVPRESSILPNGPYASAVVPRPIPRPLATRTQRTEPRAPALQPISASTAVTPDPEPIAIIGIAGRYPLARDLSEFWSNLESGRDCVTEAPPSRWKTPEFNDEHGHAFPPLKTWGGFIDGVDEFDPLFFNITPLEASFMDPQERLFLQCVHQTLEDAGHTRNSMRDPQVADGGADVGVFVGVMYEEYQLYGVEAQLSGTAASLSGHAASIANRVSYFFDFTGPSVAVDSLCSSSLTAIHLACNSLRNGECRAAISGGVNVTIHPNKFIGLAQGQFTSRTGRCHSFGAGADGYVPAEAVGAVLLKPLSRALADGDRIHGLIRGTAIGHGGRGNGYTVPNPVSQARVISEALRVANVPARSISYIEAHGTGTALGDPIEIAGLSKVFARDTRAAQFCAIGSLKSNIGHAESAAGIAGLTKVLLQMKHGKLVPTLHAEVANSHIDFGASPFYLQQKLSPWDRPWLEVDGIRRECPRRAGISAFGAGGANAHLVVEEYVATDRRAPLSEMGATLIVLSARDEPQLRERAERLVKALKEDASQDLTLADVAHTLMTGREAMEYRLGTVVSSLEMLILQLETWLGGAVPAENLWWGRVSRSQKIIALLNSDADAQGWIDGLVEKKRYGKMLQIWVEGFNIDWARVLGGAGGRRIGLPGYPFARERFWFAGSTRKLNVAAETPLPLGTEVPRREPNGEGATAKRVRKLLRKGWVVAPARESSGEQRECFIVANQGSMRLAERLRDRLGSAAILFADGLNKAVVDEAIASLPATASVGWLDLVGCAVPAGDSSAWIEGLQCWLEWAANRATWTLCVTRGLEDLHNPSVNLSGASRAGLYRMLQAECRSVRSLHLDVDSLSSDDEVLNQIVAELAGDGSETEVCYRCATRYQSELQDQSDGWRGTSTELPSGVQLGADDVVWITGGTRGLGALTARHLVRHYGVRRLVLGGRLPLLPREEWDSELQLGGPAADKIRLVRELESAGASIYLSSVSLSDAPALGAEFDEVQKTLGAATAIVHAAGTVDWVTPAFIRKKSESVSRVSEPKISGLSNLLAATATCALKRVVLFSSVSAAVPTLAVGQSDYAMANSYMDYVAHARASETPIVSIQWSSWKETGFGEVKSAAFRRSGFVSHTNEEGLELFDRVLRLGLRGSVVAGVVDSGCWTGIGLTHAPRNRDAYPRGGESVDDGRERSGGAAPTDSEKMPLREWTRYWLRRMVEMEFRFGEKDLDDDVPLGDYGVDSVMLAQLLGSIGQSLRIQLDPSVLLERPSLREFGDWLTNAYPEQIAACMARGTSQTSSLPAPGADLDTRRNGLDHRIFRAGTNDQGATPDSRIAVVGMSCQFPGGDGIDGYWELLRSGQSAIRPIPTSRGTPAEGRHAALLERIGWFDPHYFRIPPADAAALDPQALLALEESQRALSHAGYQPTEVKGGRVGVYLGGRGQSDANWAAIAKAKSPIAAMGQNYLANNVSRFFDLKGPSIVIDTACASALVALQMASQALLSEDVESALVGGISVLNPDSVLPMFEERGIAPREAKFHIFDRRAQGAIYGEGAGIVMVKTLKRALEDGDSIYAVIEAIAVNNDGRTGGPTTPNMHAQRSVMEEALRKSGRPPTAISHVEVNGSGSEVSDLLELKAIEAVYRKGSKVSCTLGSMKPNIGHPLCSEGIASLIKVVLMLHKRQHVPFLSAEEPLQHYDLKASPFEFARTTRAWETALVAGVSCFADGGTNAHVILSAAGAEVPNCKRKPLKPPTLNRRNLHETEEGTPTSQAAAETSSMGQEGGFWCRRAPHTSTDGGPLAQQHILS